MVSTEQIRKNVKVTGGKENCYLDVQRLTKSFGAHVLFQDISFSISEGQKVGLVAKNENPPCSPSCAAGKVVMRATSSTVATSRWGFLNRHRSSMPKIPCSMLASTIRAMMKRY